MAILILAQLQWESLLSLLVLDKPVDISNSIRPVCLWEGNEDLDPLIDKKGTLASWGANDNTKAKTGQLTVLKANHVQIPVASQFDCLKSDKIFRNLTSEMTFCAGKSRYQQSPKYIDMYF